MTQTLGSEHIASIRRLLSLFYVLVCVHNHTEGGIKSGEPCVTIKQSTYHTQLGDVHVSVPCFDILLLLCVIMNTNKVGKDLE